jgi:hypothetical protein
VAGFFFSTSHLPAGLAVVALILIWRPGGEKEMTGGDEDRRLLCHPLRPLANR